VRWIDRKKTRLLREQLAAIKPGARVLDIGCGTGAVLRSLGAQSHLVLFGIEPDTHLAGIARAGGLNVVSADFNGVLPFMDDTFDAVIMIDTIEHVRCRLAVINEIRRVLSNQGIVVLFTPPYDSVSWIIGEHLVYFLTRRLHVGHISPFTSESLAWLLKTTFSEITVRRFNVGLTMMGIGRGAK
jgi:ubiquinone/menaquinone biosynthesis C-methylase UbiE